MAEVDIDSKLKKEAQFGNFVGPNPELPTGATVGQGTAYMGKVASEIISPEALVITQNLQQQYPDYPILEDTTVYGNRYLSKIWAGLSYGSPLAIIGKLSLPTYGKPALFKRLNLGREILDDKELALIAHNLAVLAIELSKLVQKDPKFTEQFGQLKNRDKLNRNKLVITYGLMQGIPFVKGAEPVPTDKRLEWENYV